MEAERPRAAAHFDEQFGNASATLTIRCVQRLDIHNGVLHYHDFSAVRSHRIAAAAAQRHFRVEVEGAGGGEAWWQVRRCVAVRNGRTIHEPLIRHISCSLAISDFQIQEKRAPHAQCVRGERLKRDDWIRNHVDRPRLGDDFVATAALQRDDAVIVNRPDRVGRWCVTRISCPSDGRSSLVIVGRRLIPLVLRGARSVDVRHFEWQKRSVQTHFLVERLRGEHRCLGRDDLGGIAHN